MKRPFTDVYAVRLPQEQTIVTDLKRSHDTALLHEERRVDDTGFCQTGNIFDWPTNNHMIKNILSVAISLSILVPAAMVAQSSATEGYVPPVPSKMANPNDFLPNPPYSEVTEYRNDLSPVRSELEELDLCLNATQWHNDTYPLRIALAQARTSEARKKRGTR